MKSEYKFFKNWHYALDGVREIWASEKSFRLEICVFALLACALLFLEFERALNLFIIFSMALVLILECVNSAIERVVDLVTADFAPLAKAAKDAGSAAVMIGNFLVAFIWIYALASKFWA